MKEKPELRIFLNSQKYKIPWELKIGVTLILFITISTYLHFLFKTEMLDIIKFYSIIIGFIYFVFLLLSSPFRYQQLNGDYNGVLFFAKEYIKIGDEKISITQINKLEIDNSDIKGKITNWHKELAPRRSNGVKNYLKLYLNVNRVIITYFLQTKSDQVKCFKDEFIYYYEQNKIGWNNLGWVVDVKKENVRKR